MNYRTGYARFARFAVPIALVALLATVDASVAAAPPARVLPTGELYTHGTYVAMGDSRAAAGSPALTVDYQLNPCRRSDDNYPSLLRDKIHPRTFVNLACVGAESAHLRYYPQVRPLGSSDSLGSSSGSLGSLGSTTLIDPQLRHVPRNAQLVTVSMGGNDLGWSTMLSKCNIMVNPNCRLNPAQKARRAKGMQKMTLQSATTLRAVRARVPQAQLFTVGIGGMFGSHGCRGVQLRSADSKWFRAMFDEANARLRKETEAVGGKFIDISDRGHDACSRQPWYYGRTAPPGEIPFHLNKAGRAVIADRIAASIRR